jgi:nucleotide-binding universal stress UspA family protein
MATPRDNRTPLLGHAVVPVSDAEDASATAMALEPYDPAHVTAVHVVEKGGGVPDKTPVEQSEQIAEEAFVAVRRVFPDADEFTAYGTDVVETVVETAVELDATAIVYQSRGSNRLVRLLTGDRSLGLLTESPLPVVALPQPDNVVDTSGEGEGDVSDDGGTDTTERPHSEDRATDEQ